jgi:molecular chaperone DnaK
VSRAALGLDFGVSTTVAAVAERERCEVVADQAGTTVVPSIVAFTPAGKAIIGEDAKERRANDPTNTIHSAKRIIGEPYTSSTVKKFIEQYPYFNIERHEDGRPRFATRQGLLTSEEICAKVIVHMRDLVERSGREVKYAVVGVPSSFGKRQRKATVEAMRTAGFKDAICVGEPIAIAWGITEEKGRKPRTIAIYDFGGGTFDLAICEVRGGGVGLLAEGGDDYLGGDDVDRLLANWVVDKVLQRYQWDIRSSQQSMSRLTAEAERVKIELSMHGKSTVKLDAIEESDLFVHEELVVEMDVLESLTGDLIRRTFVACDEVIGRAGVKVNDIEEVYLAGGSSNIPFIPPAVEQYFGKAPLVVQRPEHLVAIGASMISLKCDLY